MKRLINLLIIFLSLKSYSQSYNCTEIITSSVDKITGEQTKSTKSLPFKGSYALVESPVSYTQSIKNSDTTLRMYLQALSTTLTAENYGVVILLANGIKIERPNAKIYYSADTYGWRHSAIINLNIEEIELLKNIEIEMIRLYIHDTYFSIPDPSTKGAKFVTKYNTMLRTYMKESLSCLLNY